MLGFALIVLGIMCIFIGISGKGTLMLEALSTGQWQQTEVAPNPVPQKP